MDDCLGEAPTTCLQMSFRPAVLHLPRASTVCSRDDRPGSDLFRCVRICFVSHGCMTSMLPTAAAAAAAAAATTTTTTTKHQQCQQQPGRQQRHKTSHCARRETGARRRGEERGERYRVAGRVGRVRLCCTHRTASQNWRPGQGLEGRGALDPHAAAFSKFVQHAASCACRAHPC